MSGRLARSAEMALGNATLDANSPRRVGSVVSHDGVMIEAEGFMQPLGSGARIVGANGGSLQGEVVGFRGSRSLIVPFGHCAALGSGARVEPDGDSSLVGCGTALLGRVIDAHGSPLDGRRPIASRCVWPIAGKRTNPLDRARVTRPIDTGVRAINALLTAGEGQRIAIVAGSGVGKSVLMGQMLAGTGCDVIVVGLIGERSREVSDFVETKLPPAVRAKTVVVAVPADHPPLLRLRAAARATAIAEFFRAEGKRVFLLLDSLTRVAHAQREIGLALGEPPTMKGYPPSALGLIPRLIERAGGDRRSGGSITAVYTVLADGGDTEDPVVDTARAIVDGHIVLSRGISEQGVFPAIDIARSLSRVMTDIVDADHADAAMRFRRLWSAYEDNRDLVLMGAYAPGNDLLVDDAIARREAMLGFLGQAPQARVDFAASRTALLEGFGA
jgi:flagellum-specific ATP synthase